MSSPRPIAQTGDVEPSAGRYRTQMHAPLEPHIMEHVSAAAQDTPPASQGIAGEVAARAYQVEMLDQALKQNVVVVVRVGSPAVCCSIH